MANGKRLQFVDMVKGIAILILVCYHLIAPSPFRSFFAHVQGIALVAFFFFSGYFHRFGEKTIGQSLKSRAKTLLIPFFKYSLFFWAVGTFYHVGTGNVPLKEAFGCLRNFYGGCIWNRTIQGWFGWDYYSLGKRYLFLVDFWFLIAMMLASIVFILLADRVLESKGKTFLTAAALFAVTGVLRGFGIDLPYNAQLVPFWAAFLLLGAFAGHYRVFESEKLTGGKEWAVSILTLAFGVAIAVLMPENVNLFRGSFAQNEVVNMLLCIAASLLSIWGLGTLCKKIEQAGIRVKELAWLGSHSLLIYLYHMFFAWIISIITGFSILYPEESEGSMVAKSVLLTAVCLTLCILRYVCADVVTGKRAKDPAVWGKGRAFVCTLVLAGIALGSGFLGYRSAELGSKAELELNRKIHAADLEGLFHANEVRDTIYVTGHKSPDSDTVCCAIAYATLLQRLGYDAKAVVLGPVNKETAYILNAAGVETPPELTDESGKNMILVDHSEYTQDLDSLKDATILAVIDYHGIGSVTTGNQVIYDARPMGAAATIVWSRYRDYGVEVDPTTAKLLLGGILSDTNDLKYGTTTSADIEAVKALSAIAGMKDEELATFFAEMHREFLSHEGMTDEEIFFSDYKEYEAGGKKYGIACVNCYDDAEAKEIAERLKKLMPVILPKTGMDMAFVQIGVQNDDYNVNYLVGVDEAAEEVLKEAFKDKLSKAGSAFLLNPGVSRRTVLVPALNGVLEVYPKE